MKRTIKIGWQTLRKPSGYYSLGFLVIGGFIAGVIFWGGFNTVLEATNTETFCISCHEMENNVYEELKTTIHFSNRSGVRATCPDCHVPHNWTDKIARKMQASKEVWGTIFGTINTREKFEAEPVDVSAMIEELLEQRRERITHGRLLVLRELERDAPLAWADSRGLQIALAGLLDRALEALPERGDLFVATRHLERGPDGKSKLRILLRHHNPMAGHTSDGGLAELDPRSNILEYVLAETVVASSGGSLTIDATDAQETLILIDLETPI
jgi:nitrate/TMAO reductase-like tetraheme cytochrome c subunit